MATVPVIAAATAIVAATAAPTDVDTLAVMQSLAEATTVTPPVAVVASTVVAVVASTVVAVVAVPPTAVAADMVAAVTGKFSDHV
jgi:hypothetical protein